MKKIIGNCFGWIRELRTKKLLLIFLFSFSALVVVSLVLFSLWFFQSVRTELYDNISDAASEETDRMAESLDNTISDLNSITVKLNKLGEITPSSFARDKYAAFRGLAYFNYASLKYDDMVLFYPDEVYMLSVSGTVYPSVLFAGVPRYQAMLDDIKTCRSMSFFSTMSYGASRNRALFLCVQPLSLTQVNPHYFVLYVMKYSTLRHQLLGLQADDIETLCAVYDVNGNALWSNSDWLLESHDALTGDDMIVNLDGKRYIRTRASTMNNMKMISLRLITSQFESIIRVGKSLFFVSAVLVLLAVLLIFLSVVKGYRPIEHIVKNYRTSQMNSRNKASTDLDTLNLLAASHSALLLEHDKKREDFPDEWLQELFVLNVVQGRFTDVNALNNFFRNLKIDFTGGVSFICLLLLDDTLDADKEQALRRLLSDPEQDFHGCMCILTEEKQILCLINADVADGVTRADISWRLIETLEYRATCGTGTAYSDMSDIGHSYIEAHAALDYRLIRGRSTVILFDELPEESKTHSDYPTELLNDYVMSLKSWDAEVIGSVLSNIIDYMHEAKLGLQQSRCLCYEISNAFFNQVRMQYGNAVLHIEGLDVFSISQYDSAVELMEKIRRLCDELPRYMEHLEDGQDVLFVEKCRGIMEENISNPQFSLDDVAKAFGITPQTARRRFKQQTGTTLSASLTEMRIRRAEELLVGTDMDVAEILQKVGYVDASSFTRRFRSATGLSPGQYRRNNWNRTAKADSPAK